MVDFWRAGPRFSWYDTIIRAREADGEWIVAKEASAPSDVNYARQRYPEVEVKRVMQPNGLPALYMRVRDTTR